MPIATHTKAAADHKSAAVAHEATAQLHTKGDHKAALVVIKILTLRSNILGLERPDVQVAQPRPLVISGSPEEYVAQLRSIVKNDHDVQARFWGE